MTMMRRFVAALAIVAGLAAGAAFAATLQATISTRIVATYRGTNDLGSPLFELSGTLQPSISLSSGTGSNQANLMFADTRTLSASGTENLDLAGSLADPLGTTLTFATVKAIRVCAAAANTNNVVVGGAGSNTFTGPFADATDKIAVRPGGCFLWVAPGTGATVTASTGDILLVANSGGSTSVTYDIIIIGTS